MALVLELVVLLFATRGRLVHVWLANDRGDVPAGDRVGVARFVRAVFGLGGEGVEVVRPLLVSLARR